ncbi:GNAT family N-acetyltransferase [Nocardioides sp. Arc9.136]|uniref:GNAT family N-acetyltransferase n=1 Tax=Nocardioides sp. Arc9.136 TaxID=2996826 RepID=UPI002666E114|nr:GNAT family N-acetyltransferase [Nocardioides sp. Arc9.136]WKN47810.1 GNAT family N-acetyltransferase [Nocardioides sp. Arc9.136]
MLWRVRTTLPDRPGALAVLAEHCGRAGVNILGLQIFPGVEAVTDELVLSTPGGWGASATAHLVERAGGRSVVVQPCTEAALSDQPTRYVQAARTILASPMSFPDVVARLFDAEADPVDPAGPPQDVMEMTVGDVQVQVRRTAAFTATEHARGAAIADLVSDVLQRTKAESAIAVTPGRRMGGGTMPEHVVDGDSISAVVDGVVVGLATVQGELEEDPGARQVVLRVDPAWQRRGIGTRLLVDAARLAHTLGAGEIVLTTRSDNQAVLPMVLAAGMRGRIRMAADVLTVRIAVRELRPLTA